MAAKQRSPVKASSLTGLLISTAGWTAVAIYFTTLAKAKTGIGNQGSKSKGQSYAVTNDPTFSPITTRRIFPGWFMLKMTMGRLLSLQRLTAVRSITFNPCRRISI